MTRILADLRHWMRDRRSTPWTRFSAPTGDQVTVRQLLNHTSGVPDSPVPLLELYASRQGRFRAWTPQELVALVADQPPLFPPGTAFSYSNTDYVLAGLIIETATGRTLRQELARRILRPLRLHDTFFPVNAPGIPGPRSRGYSLPLSPEGEVLDGPLLDFTVQNPSHAWAAGNLISDLDDLFRFFRALLRGRLLPARLLAEMTTPVDTGVPGFGYGLGLTVLQAPLLPVPEGRLIGHDGGIPGFVNQVLSTQDGRRQLGVMLNELVAPPAVLQAYLQAWLTIGARLLEAAPPGVASTSASLRAAIRAEAPTPTAPALNRMRAGIPVQLRP